ncbi:DUF6502 family protein [Marinobacter nauticus]|jgi:hypothetical protein|uniref:Uncharacterized protein n=1 Tax=Marinobacter nauticus TaxID=2743 RepID=A0A368UU60_MARNT|nr:DUF6502 family protein [Marinobacter nauticus]RBP71088.1 hypothetical protein DET64_109218 [Marinobacter nauticus]RCW32388.1 hypothetical protein DET51_109218 [Marinobacter nauticus]
MTDAKTKSLHQALFRILRPMARLLLRNGIPFGEFSELVKRAYVEAALEDFSDGRRKPTDSRAAVMTGLTRKEVRKQREILAGENPVRETTSHANRASRVVSGWVHDIGFQASNGEPAALAFEGQGSFSELVRKYSGDMTPRAVLDELQRVGVVSVDVDSGQLHLKQRAYVPTGDSEEMLQIFGEDVSDLVATIDHNLVSGEHGQQPLFQRTLTYNGIPPGVISEWRERAARQSQALLEELDSWLGPHDRGVSGREGGESVRTGLSIFYFEEPVQMNKSGDKE